MDIPDYDGVTIAENDSGVVDFYVRKISPFDSIVFVASSKHRSVLLDEHQDSLTLHGVDKYLVYGKTEDGLTEPPLVEYSVLDASDQHTVSSSDGFGSTVMYSVDENTHGNCVEIEVFSDVTLSLSDF